MSPGEPPYQILQNPNLNSKRQYTQIQENEYKRSNTIVIRE